MSLHLVRFRPDRLAFQRWAHQRRLLPDGVDEGYAWHALLKAAVGDDSPQPFVVRDGNGVVELLGYTTADTRLWQPMAQDPDVVQALGLDHFDARALPDCFSPGDGLSFEVRVRPIVRSRSGRGSARELDAAVHARVQDPTAEREAVYRDWLERDLGRGSAARLADVPRMVSFRRSRVVRKTQSDESRRLQRVEGPDVVFRGNLEVQSPEAFRALLARGLGRHRAFGFGCLLLAPRGVLR